MYRCLLAWAFSSLALTAVAAADVYRCTGDAGEPMFSQTPCGGTAETRVSPPPANAASGLRASESAWLRQRALARDKGRASPGRKTSKPQQRVEREGYRCRNTQRQLDRVRQRLRQGYKPSQGDKLRHRRRTYEDYLSTFCS